MQRHPMNVNSVNKEISEVLLGTSFARANRSRKSRTRQIFLISPANVSSLRGNSILSESGKSPLAQRLRATGVELGEIFTLISGLYFRGKLAYARAYADPPPRVAGVAVITASGGLVSPDRVFKLDELRAIVAGQLDAADSRYRVPLERDARLLRDQMGTNCQVILLGSIATPKYVEPLLGIFGDKLMFPAEFVGRGDMSRGGLMLRCVREEVQLTYLPLAGAERHGARPPKLPKPAQAHRYDSGDELRRAPMEAVILVGVQGSGKTSFYLDRFFDTHVRISLDMLRTRNREKTLLTACLESKQRFVIDNTNPLATDRARYIGPARAAGFHVVAYFFETTLRDAIRRNNQRVENRKVPVAGVAGTFRKLQSPTLAEGFDALYTVTISADDKFVVTTGSPKQSQAERQTNTPIASSHV